MATRIASFLLLLVVALTPLGAQVPPSPPTEGDELTPLTFPNNPVSDILLAYEALTGKRLIRDANLAGPTITLTPAQPLPKRQAIELIKSALILNGYTFVPVDEQTEKILGPSKFPRSEGVQLYTDVSQLPPGDDVVSYFMPLRFMKVDEAINAFNQYAPNRPYGSYVQIPSVNAIVITETATLVRRLVELQRVIDVQGARVIRKFFTLRQADAEKVAEVLQKMFEEGNDAGPQRVGGTVPPPAGNNGDAPNPAAAAGGAAVLSSPAPKVQVVADARTNQVIVRASEAQMDEIVETVKMLDSPTPFDDVLERPLRFVRAADVLTVVANLLVEGSDKEAQNIKVEGDQNGQNGEGASANNLAGSGDLNSSSSSSGGSGISTASRTSFAAESTKPLVAVVGRSTRVVADRSVNKIVVFGPPEARAKASRILNLLDQRAKQVYLKCVIGQLTLTNGTEAGIDYLMRFGDVRILGQGTSANIQNLLNNRVASVDLVPGTSQATDTAVNTAATVARTALPALSGLTVFGTIADSVDILARALASTGRFKVVSAPFVYTANGQGALINSGQEVPVATGSQSVVTDVNNVNNAGGTFNTSIDYKTVVLELDIRPLINSDREVTLEIRQKNDNVQENVTVGNTQVPVIATQKLNTTVTVPNRHTVVLGGLISDQESRNQNGIPFLKDIPGLGYLFSTTSKTTTRRELIIMIQPFIINTEQNLQEVQYIERANTNFREGLFDQPVPIRAATLPAPGEVPTELDFKSR